MPNLPIQKYRPAETVALGDRTWPDRTIERAPLWCSVDLRDGNQALVEPMGIERKSRMFDQLVRMGFKEIEIGFPASSEPDFDFVRWLIEGERIPDDVTIQVLTQCRDELIQRTMEAVRGARRAIVHPYNSTSPVQRAVVFGVDREGCKDIALRGTELVRKLSRDMPETEVVLEYSPESFTQTELDFALEISEAVIEAWAPVGDERVILNLPSTVEVSTPNVFADRVEWFDRSLRHREQVVLSVHPHNDRGCGVAAAELALMAGADRVEGTLLGNGERTGNVDVVTLALNLFSQGVDPEIDVFDVPEIVRVVEFCNRLAVPERHPYAGELVFTSFSGSHQDAINKALAAHRKSDGSRWDVPYLPIDPTDIGRSYEAVIRVNSQSGKGGIAYLLEQDHGVRLPRGMQIELRDVVQKQAEAHEKELSSDDIYRLFASEYLAVAGPLVLRSQKTESVREGVLLEARIERDGVERQIEGRGNGPVAAFVDALRALDLELRVADYREHSVGSGADAQAIAFVEIAGPDGVPAFGAGRHGNIVSACLQAVVSAVNRAGRSGALEPAA